MKAEEVKAIMMGEREIEEKEIYTQVDKNMEKYIFPHIKNEALKGKNYTIIKVPNYKVLYASRLTKLGYEVTHGKGRRLLIGW